MSQVARKQRYGKVTTFRSVSSTQDNSKAACGLGKMTGNFHFLQKGMHPTGAGGYMSRASRLQLTEDVMRKQDVQPEHA